MSDPEWVKQTIDLIKIQEAIEVELVNKWWSPLSGISDFNRRMRKAETTKFNPGNTHQL